MNFRRSSFFLTLLSCMLLTNGVAMAEDAGETDLVMESDIDVPAEVAPFILKDFYPILLKETDLNNDGLNDYLLVLENNAQKGMDNWNPDREITETPRPFIILQRGTDGKLSAVKRNDKVVYCRICGGAFGDPFERIELTKKGFIVHMYGGSNWRWMSDYAFGYSRIDKTWQLIQVTSTTFHTSAPDEQKVEIHKPPKDFGKIDLADFDPENYLTAPKNKKE